jgi:hypothetical protein
MISNKTNIQPAFMLIMIVIISTISCGRDKEIKGSEFIPRDTLVEVIRDIHLMDGVTNDMKYYRKYNPEDSIDLYGTIFETYGIDRETYERTIDEYSKHPELLNRVYDDVLTELNVMLEELDEKKKEVKNKQNESIPSR